MTELQLYNTRTRTKAPFVPIEPGHARVYSCGPTVYSPQHLGNMRANLFADVIKRALLRQGLRVTHVINVTDVGHLTLDDMDAGEDKMELAARTSGRSAREIADEYQAQWERDRRRLGCLEPEVLCRATDHIAEQIEMIEALDAKGVVYRIDDGLYFDVARFPRYAEFARLDLEQQRGGERIGEVSGKRHPADFALWKFADPAAARQQEWDSPWGRGFPGWHIECSAMATKYLGSHFDIHTGGVEHVTVHHTNEIAQSETALDVQPWVEVWMHEDWWLFEGEKMSKSLGNIYLLEEVEAMGILPLSVRYFFLQAHYRKQQSVTVEALEAADRGYRRALQAALVLRTAPGEPDPARIGPARERFDAAVNDDLNAPRALAVALEVLRDESLSPADRRTLLTDFDSWLGLDLLTAELPQEKQEEDPRIDGLVAERQAARASKDWARADEIRDELAAEGIVVEDTKDGPIWKRG